MNLVKNGFFLTSWSIASDSLITPCQQMGRSNMYIFRFVCTVRFLAVDSLIILGVPKSTFIMIQTLLLGLRSTMLCTLRQPSFLVGYMWYCKISF